MKAEKVERVKGVPKGVVRPSVFLPCFKGLNGILFNHIHNSMP